MKRRFYAFSLQNYRPAVLTPGSDRNRKKRKRKKNKKTDKEKEEGEDEEIGLCDHVWCLKCTTFSPQHKKKEKKTKKKRASTYHETKHKSFLFHLFSCMHTYIADEEEEKERKSGLELVW